LLKHDEKIAILRSKMAEIGIFCSKYILLASANKMIATLLFRKSPFFAKNWQKRRK
jgi:hypothetical protein